MSGDAGVTVVTTLVCSLHISHARLRVHWAPGIPCALSFLGEWFFAKTRAHRAAGMRMCDPSCRGDAKHRTRNLEIPGLVLTHHPGMTVLELTRWRGMTALRGAA